MILLMNILDLLKPLVFILILVAILAAVLSAVFSKKNGKKVYPYQAISHLFTPAERSFLGVLDQAVYPSCRAFGKVRVADVLKVKKGMARSDWQAAFNKICSKHFDYVICRASDLRILLVIESHSLPEELLAF